MVEVVVALADVGVAEAASVEAAVATSVAGAAEAGYVS